MCAPSIFSHAGPPSVPTTCMLPVVQHRGYRKEITAGWIRKDVGGIPQAVCIQQRCALAPDCPTESKSGKPEVLAAGSQDCSASNLWCPALIKAFAKLGCS